MDRIQEVMQEYGGLLCRRCLNEIYNASLVQKDCMYDGPELRICTRCKKQSHLVWDLKGSGKRKLLFKKMNPWYPLRHLCKEGNNPLYFAGVVFFVSFGLPISNLKNDPDIEIEYFFSVVVFWLWLWAGAPKKQISRSTVDLDLKNAMEKEEVKSLGVPGAGSYLFPILAQFGVIRT